MINPSPGCEDVVLVRWAAVYGASVIRFLLMDARLRREVASYLDYGGKVLWTKAGVRE